MAEFLRGAALRGAKEERVVDSNEQGPPNVDSNEGVDAVVQSPCPEEERSVSEKFFLSLGKNHVQISYSSTIARERKLQRILVFVAPVDLKTASSQTAKYPYNSFPVNTYNFALKLLLCVCYIASSTFYTNIVAVAPISCGSTMMGSFRLLLISAFSTPFSKAATSPHSGAGTFSVPPSPVRFDASGPGGLFGEPAWVDFHRIYDQVLNHRPDMLQQRERLVQYAKSKVETALPKIRANEALKSIDGLDLAMPGNGFNDIAYAGMVEVKIFSKSCLWNIVADAGCVCGTSSSRTPYNMLCRN